MPNFILNGQSVLLCPHGGPVIHVPVTFTTYRVNGYPPLLLTDNYLISGCPAGATGMGQCTSVQWFNPSSMLLIKGIPVLTNGSLGTCQGGPLIIANFQTIVQEPAELTNIQQ